MQCLSKDNSKRVNIDTLAQNEWLTKGGKEPLELYTADFMVSDEEINRAITPINIGANIFAISKISSKLARKRSKMGEAYNIS